MPFGFGAFFVLGKPTMLGVLGWGAAAFALIELLQLLLGVITGVPLRVVDINDVLLNTLGVAIGIGIFQGFAALFRRLDSGSDISGSGLLSYVRPVVQTTGIDPKDS